MDFIDMKIMYMIAYDVYCLYIFRAQKPYMLNCHCVLKKIYMHYEPSTPSLL